MISNTVEGTHFSGVVEQERTPEKTVTKITEGTSSPNSTETTGRGDGTGNLRKSTGT